MSKNNTTPTLRTRFRFAEMPILFPERLLCFGQSLSVSVRPNTQLAAFVAGRSHDRIGLQLTGPEPPRGVHSGGPIRVKFWNEQEAYYFQSRILQVEAETDEQWIAIARPHEGVAVQTRTTFRVNESIPLSFTVVEAHRMELIGQEVPNARTRNITVGALAFDTTVPLEVGDRLDMKLQLSGSRAVSAMGTVIRCSSLESNPGGTRSIALKFFQLDAQEQSELLQFLVHNRPSDT